MHHHGKWKRHRPHTMPVVHRTLHRYSWERTMRHEAASHAVSGVEKSMAFLLNLLLGFAVALAICAVAFVCNAALSAMMRVLMHAN